MRGPGMLQAVMVIEQVSDHDITTEHRHATCARHCLNSSAALYVQANAFQLCVSSMQQLLQPWDWDARHGQEAFRQWLLRQLCRDQSPLSAEQTYL